MTTHRTGESYDVIIIGAGPAGIFSGLELARGRNGQIRVAIIEKGPDIDARICPSTEGRSACRRCDPCSVVSVSYTHLDVYKRQGLPADRR